MFRLSWNITWCLLAMHMLVNAALAGELVFSSQRSLLLPDPFIKKKEAKIEKAFSCKGQNCIHDVTSTSRKKLDLRLVDLIEAAETHFGKQALIASGCRSDLYNKQVGGAPRSFHLSCDAADLIIPGVSVREAKLFFEDLVGVGGIGTYCYLTSIHIDVGPSRRWHRDCSLAAQKPKLEGVSAYIARFDLHE